VTFLAPSEQDVEVLLIFVLYWVDCRGLFALPKWAVLQHSMAAQVVCFAACMWQLARLALQQTYNATTCTALVWYNMLTYDKQNSATMCRSLCWTSLSVNAACFS
jgi:hypothetical protein